MYGLRKMCSGLPDRSTLGKRQIGRGNDQAQTILALSEDDAHGGTVMSEETNAQTTGTNSDRNTGRPRVATAWLDGCSGCHMSFLDLDERLLEIIPRIELVYGPLVDAKDYPDHVNVALIEGAVSGEEHAQLLKTIRENTDILISFGDCAVTGNVPAIRNQFKLKEILERAYIENVSHNPAIPKDRIPPLYDCVKPVHELVPVDLFLPGCPPQPDVILYTLSELLEGRIPEINGRSRFGA